MITKEKLVHHIKHLQQQHDQFDSILGDEHEYMYRSDLEITEMKKQKLHLKDEIEKFKKQMEEL